MPDNTRSVTMLGGVIADVVKAVAIFCVVAQHVILPLYGEDCAYYRVCSAFGAPLFFIVAGYLSRPQPIGAYYVKKVWRVLIPFIFFCCLKLAFSLITGLNAHAESIGGMLYDAFVLGRLYWFAYVIFGMFLLAPLIWKVKSAWVVLVIAVGLYIIFRSVHWDDGWKVFQFHNVLKSYPLFMVGYGLRILVKPEHRVRSIGIIWLTARYTWQIMLMEGLLRVIFFVIVPIPVGVMRILLVPVLTLALIVCCICASVVCERILIVRKLVGV